MAEHNEIGERGEQIAQAYLTGKGYKLVAINWRYRKDELDIITKYKDTMIFVEGKTRTSRYFENPKDAVTIKKQRNIIRAANAFMEENNIDLESRFDIVSILIEDKKEEIEHIEDAFYPML